MARTSVFLVVLTIVVTPYLARGDVVQHHRNGTRDGMFVDPRITHATAATTRRDPTFSAPVPGPTYAQPLYVANGPGGRAAFIVATEQNVVLTLDASNGTQLWVRTLGTPVGLDHFPCGNIHPYGITGTPVVDPDARALYVAAMTTPDDGTTKKQRVFAPSLDDGSTLPGWPLDLSGLTTPDGQISFNSTALHQRSALLLNAGMLYVPYHGHEGLNCVEYHGWVVAVPAADPQSPTAWAVPAQKGGVWAPGGLSTDGSSIFAATGNTVGASTWMGGEAIIRLGAGTTFSGNPADFFTPSNWETLDAEDLDLGSSGPVLIDVPGATPSQLVIALGKNGVVYLLDRNNLGGIGTGDGTVGEGVQSARVANRRHHQRRSCVSHCVRELCCIQYPREWRRMSGEPRQHRGGQDWRVGATNTDRRMVCRTSRWRLSNCDHDRRGFRGLGVDRRHWGRQPPSRV